MYEVMLAPVVIFVLCAGIAPAPRAACPCKVDVGGAQHWQPPLVWALRPGHEGARQTRRQRCVCERANSCSYSGLSVSMFLQAHLTVSRFAFSKYKNKCIMNKKIVNHEQFASQNVGYRRRRA